MNNIKVLKNIITKEEADLFINYINANLHLFDDYSHNNNPERYALRFGVDDVYVGAIEGNSYHTLEQLSDIHDNLRNFFLKITTEVEEVYGSEKTLYVTSFHMGKQMPNSVVGNHLDADPEHNGHFKYSCVVYLNTNVVGGELEFPYLSYAYQPKEFEAVVFPSQGLEYQHEVSAIEQVRYCLPMWLTEDPSWEIKFS